MISSWMIARHTGFKKVGAVGWVVGVIFKKD